MTPSPWTRPATPGELAVVCGAVLLFALVKWGAYFGFLGLLAARSTPARARIGRAVAIRALAGVAVLVLTLLLAKAHTIRTLLGFEAAMLLVRPLMWWLCLPQLRVALPPGRVLVAIFGGTILSYGIDALTLILIVLIAMRAAA